MRSPRVARALGSFLLAAGSWTLIASLWMPWYRLDRVIAYEPSVIPPASFFSAWARFALVDVLLMVVALAALVLALATARGWRPPRRWSLPVTLMLANGVALVLFRMAHAPDLGRLPEVVQYSVSVGYGSLVALIAAGTLVLGSWLSAEAR
ncbi:MAG: hypothetical protein H0T15_01360 [Thermoleophilaceae bacterium]|nr:hypothetical protein [Thermoleophilaceae bacterium]